MHATYYFLTDIDNQADANNLANAIDRAICGYATENCDENNWWAIEGAVLANDRRLDLSSGTRLDTRPGIWCQAWIEACRAVAWSMLVWHSMPDDSDTCAKRLADPGLGRAEIIDLVFANVPTTLASRYAALVSGSGLSSDPADQYDAACLADQFERFRAADCERLAPFSRQLATPYDYRAFSLCEPDQGNAIIVADIHT